MTINRDINDLFEPFKTNVLRFLDDCKNQGFLIFITEGYRSPERQKELYAQGRTKPGKIVTWTLESKHCQRQAIDIGFHSPSELYPKDINIWNKVYDIAEKYNLVSLYRKYGVDLPHLEWKGTIPYAETKEMENYILINKFMSKYLEIMKKEVPENERIFKDYSGNEPLSEQDVKSLISIALYRAKQSFFKK